MIATGYYRPGCTDPDFPEPACRRQCKDHNWDFVYQSDRKAWACCNDTTSIGRAGADCRSSPRDNPTLGEPFPAPAPEDLTPYFTIPAAGAVQETAAPPPSSGNLTTTGDTAALPLLGERLTAGAAAGIGVGAGLGTALFVIGVGLWSLRRRRRRRHQGLASGRDEGLDLQQHQQQKPQSGYTTNMHSGVLRGSMSPRELGTCIRPEELQA